MGNEAGSWTPVFVIGFGRGIYWEILQSSRPSPLAPLSREELTRWAIAEGVTAEHTAELVGWYHKTHADLFTE
jgi:hypothetical protein